MIAMFRPLHLAARLLTALALVLLVAATVRVADAQVLPRPAKKGRQLQVTIDSAPQQALIYLDDKRYGIVGYTPWSGKLATGQWTLIVEQAGHEPYTQIVLVDRQSRTFFVPLVKQAQPAVLDVQAAGDANVNGAVVHVDGLAQGTAPLMLELAAGRHQVELKKAGFHDLSQWVTLVEAQRLTLTPVLRAVAQEKPKGSLLVDADVADAEVYVNGRLQPDTTPAVIDALDEGDYVVEVRKAPAAPWRQSVYVTAGKRTKISAALRSAVVTARGGTVRVLATAAGTEIFLDGKSAGTVAPGGVLDLGGLTSGAHLLEARARGYAPQDRQVVVNEGSSEIVKFELVAVAASRIGVIKVVSPVPEARVYVDGASVGTAPVEREVVEGEHYVVVEKEGYTRFEQKLAVVAGQALTVTAALSAVGSLRFLSTPDGAEVVLDGAPVGVTPLVKEGIDVGPHHVIVRLADHGPFETDVVVEGGKLGIVNATLQKIALVKTAASVTGEKWSLSTHGARVAPPGRFGIDLSLGYPYLLEGRATVGAKDGPGVGWDIGLGVRSLLTNWEFLGTLRLRFFEGGPFASAGFFTIGGGGGASGRNSFTLQTGLLQTITFRGGVHTVTLTGRAFLDVWSDRLCGLDEAGAPLDAGPDVCRTGASAEPLARAQALTGNTSLHDRDSGLRAVLSFVAEIALTETWNGFLIFEGAPFQGERAAYTDVFNATMLLGDDPIYNGRLGVTAKF